MKINAIIALLVLFVIVLSNNVIDRRLESINLELKNTILNLEDMVKSGRNSVEILATIYNDRYTYLD